jgi:hypothetical protein
MNTPERNNKNVEKMKKLGKVYEDSADDKSREEDYTEAMENATREYPLATARRFAWVACGGFWVFCLGVLLFGIDLRGLFPFLFFSLAVVSALHIPMFYIQKKTIDVIAGTIFAISCTWVAVSLLVGL